jgi:hypothetical protein
MAEVLIAIVVDGKHICPIDDCGASYPKLKSLQKHSQRTHNRRVTVAAAQVSIEEKRTRQRRYAATYRGKHKKRTRAVKSKHRRTPFDIEDADARGLYLCDDPLLEYKESAIPNAGNGLFAREVLLPGDIVTWYSGNRSMDPASDRSYTIAIDGGFVNGITTPIQDQGLGSFINRECRNLPKCRKNCVFVECPGADHLLYVEVIAKIKPGAELYTTYSRGYRIPKSAE